MRRPLSPLAAATARVCAGLSRLPLLLAALAVLPPPAWALAIRFVIPDVDPGTNVVHVPYDRRQLRFGGYVTERGATLTMNGESLRVWETGAFAGRWEDLEVGENRFTFVAREGGETVRRTVRIFRAAAERPLPRTPARVAPRSIRPDEPVLVAPNDSLNLSVRASTQGEAVALIGDVRVPLVEDSRDRGLYRGVHRVSGDEGWSETPIRVRIRAGGTEDIETGTGTVTSLDIDHPPVLVVDAPERGHCPMYPAPDGENRIGDLPPGTRLTISGRRDRHWRAQLAPREDVWIPVNSDAERFTRPGDGYALGRLNRLAIRGEGTRTVVALELEHPMPAHLDPAPDLRSVELHVYGLTRDPEDGAQVSGDVWTGTPTWRRVGERHHVLRLPLRRALWGYDLRFEGSVLLVTLRPAPAREPGRPLGGLTITLDAGHGGDDPGARGSTGLNEADVALQITQALARELRERGADVRLLRDADETIELNRRARESIRLEPDLFLSIHANSIGVEDNPMASRGPTTYHAHPHARGLAQAIQRRLAAMGDVRDNGVKTENFRVLRPAQFPAVLVETLFVSHPGDEAKLLSATWRARIAGAIAEGVEEFLRSAPR